MESRGTEAVLNALILARALTPQQSRREPSESYATALGVLWETQRSYGAWDWLDFGLEPFESVDAAYYGATLAALAIGSYPAPLNRSLPRQQWDREAARVFEGKVRLAKPLQSGVAVAGIDSVE